MEINFSFNLWDNLFSILSIIIGVIVAFYIHKLSKQQTANDKYSHEIKITKEIQKIEIFKNVILADVKKYNPLREDNSKTYYKQGAELYTIIPEYGVQFILRPSDDKIPVGLVPFEWIEYIRQYDSEDNKPIVVCRFKGIKWYEKFKSPFKEINYIYKNLNYTENSEPKFLKYTTVNPINQKQ